MLIIDIISEYVIMQDLLCNELRRRYPSVDSPLLTVLPRCGSISIEDSIWEFCKHGAGVMFTSLCGGEVIDVHRYPPIHSKEFDAWRLIQFFESKGIAEVDYKSNTISVETEPCIDELLRCLLRDGVIAALDEAPSVYVLIDLDKCMDRRHHYI